MCVVRTRSVNSVLLSTASILVMVVALAQAPAEAQFVCAGSLTGAEPQAGAAGSTAAGAADNLACGRNANAPGGSVFDGKLAIGAGAVGPNASGNNASNIAIGGDSNSSGASGRNVALGNDAGASGTLFPLGGGLNAIPANTAVGWSSEAGGNGSLNVAIGAFSRAGGTHTSNVAV